MSREERGKREGGRPCRPPSPPSEKKNPSTPPVIIIIYSVSLRPPLFSPPTHTPLDIRPAYQNSTISPDRAFFCERRDEGVGVAGSGRGGADAPRSSPRPPPFSASPFRSPPLPRPPLPTATPLPQHMTTHTPSHPSERKSTPKKRLLLFVPQLFFFRLRPPVPTPLRRDKVRAHPRRRDQRERQSPLYSARARGLPSLTQSASEPPASPELSLGAAGRH